MTEAVELNNSSQMKDVIEVALMRYNRTYFSDGSFNIHRLHLSVWKLESIFELYVHSALQKGSYSTILEWNLLFIIYVFYEPSWLLFMLQ